MLEKEITYLQRKTKVRCDGRCDLAKGLNPPRESTSEGGHVWSPENHKNFPNKWCVRECDRCEMESYALSKPVDNGIRFAGLCVACIHQQNGWCHYYGTERPPFRTSYREICFCCEIKEGATTWLPKNEIPSWVGIT